MEGDKEDSSGNTEIWVIESLGISDMLRLLSGSCVYMCVLEPLILSLPSPRFIGNEIYYFNSIYTHRGTRGRRLSPRSAK